MHDGTGFALAGTAFLLALAYRAAALTWLGSVFALATLWHVFDAGTARFLIPHPALAADSVKQAVRFWVKWDIIAA